MKLTSVVVILLLALSGFAGLSLLLPSALAAQFGRPSSTVSAGGWTAVGAATLHEATDEVTANDGTDYAEADSSDTTMELALSSITDPVSNTSHTMRMRIQVTGGGAAGERLDWQLFDGGTLIHDENNLNLKSTRNTWTDFTYTLTATEADSIGNYGDLRFRFVVATLGGGENILMTWTEFEVPNVGGVTCEALTVVITNPSGQMFFNATTDTPVGGLWQEENVSEDFQTASVASVNVTNDDAAGACDVTLELLTNPGAGRTMKFSTTSTPPNPGVDGVPVGSNVTVIIGLANGATVNIWLWIDLADSQGGQMIPTLRVDTKTAAQ